MSGYCHGCGVELEPSRGGPRRKWCGDRCRKRQYDRECIDCGTRVDGTTPSKSSGRCVRCAARVPKAHVVEHRVMVEAMWADGYVLREICDALGQNHTKSILASWRSRGYDLPYRRSPEALANIIPAAKANMSRARRQKVAA